MPTLLRTGPCRIYTFSHDLHEPPHVPVDRERFSAKFWLQPVALARNLGFKARELRRIERIIEEHQSELLEEWDGNTGDEC
ncbi:MAG: DUF4160 domain-containing protein [Terriglobia bacterium]